MDKIPLEEPILLTDGKKVWEDTYIGSKKDGYWFNSDQWEHEPKPTHWKPLPDPPQNENEKK